MQVSFLVVTHHAHASVNACLSKIEALGKPNFRFLPYIDEVEGSNPGLVTVCSELGFNAISLDYF
jgi:hypothetical protein